MCRSITESNSDSNKHLYYYDLLGKGDYACIYTAVFDAHFQFVYYIRFFFFFYIFWIIWTMQYKYGL